MSIVPFVFDVIAYGAIFVLVVGISTSNVYAATFTFGTALAGLAGGPMVPIYSLSADMDVPFLIKSFLAFMLGGPGGFECAMAGPAFVDGSSAALPGFASRQLPMYGS